MVTPGFFFVVSKFSLACFNKLCHAKEIKKKDYTSSWDSFEYDVMINWEELKGLWIDDEKNYERGNLGEEF